MSHFVTHIRIVAALVVREMTTRFGRKPGGYIWALVNPAAYIAMMSFLFMAISHAPPLGTSFPLFFATGYLGFQFYKSMAGYLNDAVPANRSLLIYPNIVPFDIILARFTLQLGTEVVVAFCIIGGIGTTLHWPLVVTWPYVIEAVLLASLLALGGGLANNVLFAQFPLYRAIYDILMRPLLLISGIFYLPESIPHPFQDLLLINPLVHVVMLFRKGFYPEYRAMLYDPVYLYSFVFSVLFAGFMIFTGSREFLRKR